MIQLCSKCKGTGEIEVVRGVGSSAHKVECPVCNGDGYMIEED